LAFQKTQSLNQWVDMLDAMYGGAQNYAKTPFEIHVHLSEVCGIFAKHSFKRKDLVEAEKFLPKIFSWAVALFRKVSPRTNDLESIILRKFPNLCPYCLTKPCQCWAGVKPTLNEQQLRNEFYNRAPSARRSINDFQMMFREIYSESWQKGVTNESDPDDVWRKLFIRMVEELAEVAEAIRFHHLYPENFENELADLFAWWFALTSTLRGESGVQTLLAEDLLWKAYPGHCPDCLMLPCLCRPGPVRQLMSRPVPGHSHRFDSMTTLLNQAAYKEDLALINNGSISLTFPSACVRLDVDNFKAVNDTYGHAAGDEALRHIAATIRRVVRERDRVYRISGDEFGVLCADYTAQEAAGAMTRICVALLNNKVRWVNSSGKVSEFNVSVSIGVAELSRNADIEGAFDRADKASYASKQAGKGTVSIAPKDHVAQPAVE
jgi:diguanylate cyclase (GGDEF)-like protein